MAVIIHTHTHTHTGKAKHDPSHMNHEVYFSPKMDEIAAFTLSAKEF